MSDVPEVFVIGDSVRFIPTIKYTISLILALYMQLLLSPLSQKMPSLLSSPETPPPHHPGLLTPTTQIM